VKVFYLTSILKMYCKIGHVSDTRDDQNQSSSEEFDSGEGPSSVNLGPSLNASTVPGSLTATANDFVPAFNNRLPSVQTPPQQQLCINKNFLSPRTDSLQSSPMYQQLTYQQMQQMSPWPPRSPNFHHLGPYNAPPSNSLR
jgi:hypothetical protein